MRVGFIGLGRMGRPMCNNLLKAGFPLWVHSRRPDPVQELAAAGARPCGSPAELARQVDVVLTCLPGPAEVELVYTGPNGVLAGAAPGLVAMDHSTIDPGTVGRVGAAAVTRGMAFLDAPVSGGTAGAAQGTLTFMVGGDAGILAGCEPVLRAMGLHVRHIGPLGAGSTAKLINQMLVGIYSLAIGQAFVLGAKRGLDPEALLAVLQTSFGNNGVLERHLRTYILPGQLEPAGATIDTVEKDCRLAVALAGAERVEASLGAQALHALQAAQAAGLGHLDMAGLIRPIEQAAGVRITGSGA